MEETSKEKLADAWTILSKLIDENKILKEENLKLHKKIQEMMKLLEFNSLDLNKKNDDLKN